MWNLASGFSAYAQASAVLSGLLNEMIDTFSVWPIVTPYAPSPSLTVGDLTLGTGTVGEIEATGFTAAIGLDPTTGLYRLLFEPPVGGWTWHYDGVTPAPTVTVFGFAFADDSAGGGGQLYAVSDPLRSPLVLSGPTLVTLGDVSLFVAATITR